MFNIEEIRARHEVADLVLGKAAIVSSAHADRATLLATLDATLAENARLKEKLIEMIRQLREDLIRAALKEPGQ